MEYEELKVPMEGGSLLAWVIEADTKTSDVVLAAGDGTGNMADELRLAQALAQDATVVLFDWRGLGESADWDIDPGLILSPTFTTDLEAMVDFAADEGDHLTVVGVGVGETGGLALALGWVDPEVDAILAEAGWGDLDHLAEALATSGEALTVPGDDWPLLYTPAKALGAAPTGDKDVTLYLSADQTWWTWSDFREVRSLTDEPVRVSTATRIFGAATTSRRGSRLGL